MEKMALPYTYTLLRTKETHSPNPVTSENKKLIIITELNLFMCNEKLYKKSMKKNCIIVT